MLRFIYKTGKPFSVLFLLKKYFISHLKSVILIGLFTTD